MALVVFSAVAASGCHGSANDGGAPPTAPPAATPADAQPVTLTTCPIGQMARLASDGCESVGPNAPPAGFEPAPNAWGFRAIVSPSDCREARAAIGSLSCVPIDDCAAPFPPAGAAFVVRPSGAVTPAAPGAPAVETSLATALGKSKPGDVIALDEGTYGAVVVPHDISLVGRCAAKVVFSPQSSDEVRGVAFDSPFAVGLQSLTLRGFNFGVWASAGKLSVDRVVFDDNGAGAWITREASIDVRESLFRSSAAVQGDGVIAARGGHAKVSESEFRAVHVALDAFGAGTDVAAEAIVASEQSTEESALLVASEGAAMNVTRSRVAATARFVGGAKDTDTRDPGSSAPATLHVSQSELLRIQPTDAAGFDVTGGSSLILDESTLAVRARIAISAESSANVALQRSVVRPYDVTDVAKRKTGAGVVMNDDARLSLDGAAILGMAQSAILAAKGCKIQVMRSLVRGTWEFERVDFSTRMHSGQAISLAGDATLEMSDSRLEDNAGAAIWMDQAETSASITRTAIVSTTGDASTSVVGVLALGGTLQMDGSLVHGMTDASLALGAAKGSVARSVLSQSSAAIRVMGTSRVVESADDGQRPNDGELLWRKNTLVAVGVTEVDDALPLGDCRCAGSSIAGH